MTVNESGTTAKQITAPPLGLPAVYPATVMVALGALRSIQRKDSKATLLYPSFYSRLHTDREIPKDSSH